MKHFISSVSVNSKMDRVRFQNCSRCPHLDHPQESMKLINGIMVPIMSTTKRDEKIQITLMINTLDTMNSKSRFFKDENRCFHEEWIVSELTQRNYYYFIAELHKLKKKIGFEYELTILPVPENENAETHFELFRTLVRELQPKQTDEPEELYADMTFGMKPISMILFMVFNYLYRFTNNALPKLLIYVFRNHDTKEKSLFELSHLFHMNAMFEHMTGLNVKDPLEYVERLLGMQEEGMLHETRPES